jgi:DNA invertase Pin-like site-specific DNA recombinase
LRTSSAANVGTDRDSDKRQRAAIAAFCKRSGFEIVDEFYDPAVSGTDPIETRPGFSALLDRIESNGVRTVIVEDATRFARDLITQELGIVALVARGVTVLTAGGDDLTNTDDHFKVAMRQIAGAFAQLEKARLVAKLRAARERKRKEGHKVEGRKSLAESRPEAVELARKLSEERPRRSLREISAELALQGFSTPRGLPYSASAVASMLG